MAQVIDFLRYLPDGPGLSVLCAFPGTASASAGIRRGDKVVEVNGHPISCADDYLAARRNSGPTLRIKVVREGRLIELRMKNSRAQHS